MAKKYLLLLAISCVVVNGLKAQNLQDDLNSVFTDNQLMGMSVYTFTGETENVYSFGLRNFNQGLPINEDTKFRIASISKSFTALGLMKLYDQGLFQLDDDISTYIGFMVRNPAYPNVPITFRMLLSHTSSLQDGSGYSSFLNATYSQSSIPDISQLVVPTGTYFTSNMWRTEPPGEYFTYSNLNFGIIGTLIEKISNQRFDVFMRSQILLPMGISGSYNVQDLSDIANLATIYRNISGWTPQADNFNGVMPSPPNLDNYIIGTNGLYFGPQGGLRVSTQEIGMFLKFIKSNGLSTSGLISSNTIEQMKAVQWNYNGSNGDNYYGLFNKWGLGLHFANTNNDDFICNSSMFGEYIGHTGEAYGLISDAFYSSTQDSGFVFLTNGSYNGYQTNSTSFYTVEDEVFSVICNYFSSELDVSHHPENVSLTFLNPVTDGKLYLKSPNKEDYSVEILNSTGTLLLRLELTGMENIIDVSWLPSGVYLLQHTAGDQKEIRKLIIL